ncbi:hypothetical protein ZHAS_00005895 [Anopheles sinensis]|uniref:Uncharacterized protein n=1 Tax=Anopheles sinensis TaxID=74873 RepID=A0A084VKJ6_ANOSI|nr:hypothetical protein ZHAS_00005895 [Anopheles sinensis]
MRRDVCLSQAHSFYAPLPSLAPSPCERVSPMCTRHQRQHHFGNRFSTIVHNRTDNVREDREWIAVGRGSELCSATVNVLRYRTSSRNGCCEWGGVPMGGGGRRDDGDEDLVAAAGYCLTLPEVV